MNGGFGRLLRIVPVFALIVAACAGTSDESLNGDTQTGSGSAPGGHPPAASRGSDPAPVPAQLVGLDGDQLDDLLGPADFTRSDGPAEIRQYRDSACVLDLFLYADAAPGRYRVAHVDARNRVSGGTAEQACAASLLRARQLRTAS